MPVDHGPLSELPLARYRPYSRLRLPQTTVHRASALLHQAYAELMQLYPGEATHNRDAFYDYLCALDFL